MKYWYTWKQCMNSKIPYGTNVATPVYNNIKGIVYMFDFRSIRNLFINEIFLTFLVHWGHFWPIDTIAMLLFRKGVRQNFEIPEQNN